MAGLFALYEIIAMIVNVFVMLIIVQFNVVNQSNQFLMQVYNSIGLILDPILRPVRRIMPDTGAIDFSPIVLILGMNAILIVLRAAITG